MYKDRREAGQLLAGELRVYARKPDVTVFGLPRGGIVVAYEVAGALEAPLEALAVRKLGVPNYPELAMGAIAPGGVIATDRSLIRSLGISDDQVLSVVREEKRELKRRENLYRGGRPMPDLKGKTAIVVDDGLATGFTMRASLLALKKKNPAKIVAAVPVCAPQSCRLISSLADCIVCYLSVAELGGIGQWYGDFEQVTDEDVISLLDRSGDWKQLNAKIKVVAPEVYRS